MSTPIPEQILVIETAFLGDVVLSLSLAVRLKQLLPSSHVAYLVRPDAATIAGMCPAVDAVYPFDKHGEDSGNEGLQRVAEKLNEQGFDTIFLLHSSLRSQLLCRELKATRKIGFSGSDRAELTAAIADTGWTHRFERPQILLQALDSSYQMFALPRLSVQKEQRQSARPKVAIAPGSVWPTKRWPTRKFAELARQICDRGCEVDVIGGKEEVGIGAEIAFGISGARNHCGALSIVESASIIASSNLLISNDSAPAHLALAVGTPVIEIFGPTVPAFGFAPPGGKGSAIELPDLWCRPCTSHGSATCPIHTHACMEQISVEAVLNEARLYLRV